MPSLYDPLTAGALALPHRVVMAPMTRNRAGADGVPGPLMTEYYAQRASAGLIVTEGVRISPAAAGPAGQPGLHTPEQIAGWAEVTGAVHRAGGRIVAQLSHHGRIAHPDLLPEGLRPLAPSAVTALSDARTPKGLVPTVEPRAMTAEDIATTLADFATAAAAAVEAGFDGVELQGANGYLIHQFLCDNTNLREDGYGGDPAARIRFAVEAVRTVSDAIGADRVALRISPASGYNDTVEQDPSVVYGLLADALDAGRLAYLHLVESADERLNRLVRERWAGTLLTNPFTGDDPTDPETAARRLDTGAADAVAFARYFSANPDLPERIRRGLPLTEPDEDTFHEGGATGYTDFAPHPADAAVEGEQQDQYAGIGDRYSDFKDTAPLAGPEQHNVLKHLGDLNGRRVLDLACGHGHYTRLIKAAGAAEAVGVDLSPVMVELARATERERPLGITYHVGDAVALPRLGAFDLVSAVWLLNYATTKAELTAMLRGIHDNLAPGGRFVALTVRPEFEPFGPKWDAYGLRVVSETPDGDRGILVTDLIGTETSTITTSRWSHGAFAECLAAAGFEDYAWAVPEVPAESVERFGDAFWDNYRANPIPGLLVGTRPVPGADRVRTAARTLAADLAGGRWTPTALERSLAGRLLTSAPDGSFLTARAVRDVFWEGSEAFTRENDGRLAALLADAVPLLEAEPGSEPAGEEADAAARELVALLRALD
ncbi:methyltransferase domain-containing protein [Streptomyces sp. NPDC090056]|uniref:oxidoreductase n=1 Tax=Streptomyces sp. NPDC090056 TaxID=3365934 RepID=UPI0038193763